MERWYKTLKGGCIRIKTPLSLEDARRIVTDFVTDSSEVRLHSAIGYVTARGRAGRSCAGDLRRAGSQAGCGAAAAEPGGALTGALSPAEPLPDWLGGPMMEDDLGGG